MNSVLKEVLGRQKLGLSDLANESTGHSDKFKFQINHKIFSANMSTYNIRHTSLEKKSVVVYLIFKFNWTSLFFSGKFHRYLLEHALLCF